MKHTLEAHFAESCVFYENNQYLGYSNGNLINAGEPVPGNLDRQLITY